jgi:hypothetical protein
MNLSTNLTLAEMVRSESAKRHNISNQPTPQHLENMRYLAEKIFQPIRDHFRFQILISSGYRSAALNKKIGGSNSSFHSKGCAIDIDNDNTLITNKQIFEFIKENLEFTELIWEKGSDTNPAWVHVAIVKGREKEKEILKTKDGKTYTKFK